MILKRIKLNNIRSYENAEIHFPEKSILLWGDIGSGKTTVLMSIEFSLFGLQPGQKGSALLRNGKNRGSVELEFFIEGKNIIIERSLRRGKSVNQDYSALTIDGIKKEMAVSELKSNILNIINYPAEFAKKTNLLYKYTVYTPQEEMKQIILEDFETRLNTLRHIFGIDKYKKIRDNTAIFTARLRENIRKKEGMIQDIESKRLLIEEKNKIIHEYNTKIKEIEAKLLLKKEGLEKIKKLVIEIEEKLEQKRDYEKEIEKTKALLAGKKEILSNRILEAQALEKQIEEIERAVIDINELATIEKNREELLNKEAILNKKTLELSGNINAIKKNIADSDKLKEQILKLKLCPTCLQNVDNDYKKNVIKKLDDDVENNKELIEKSEKELSDLNKILSNTKKEISDIESRKNELLLLKMKTDSIKEKKERLNEINKSRLIIEKDIDFLNKHITNIKESLLPLSNIHALYEARKKELDSANDELKAVEIEIAEQKKEIEFANKEILLLKQEIAEKEETRKKLIYITELEKWLASNFLSVVSNIEKVVMLKLRGEFSRLFNNWFSMLITDNLIARLDENFTPIIEQEGYEIDYSYLSGGERTAVALAYRLALDQVLNSLLSNIKTRDIIILDEPTDGFSDQQLDKMRDVLQQLKIKQLILVSHEQKIEGFVNHVIRFKKENGVTVVSDEEDLKTKNN